MAQDYAKKHASTPEHTSEFPRWTWFAIGFLFGLFTAFLVYLWHEVVPDPSSTVDQPTADVIANKQRDDSKLIDYSFFEMFPNVVVPVVEEYTPTGEKVVIEDKCIYVLQVGSFKNTTDADRLRGELILMGMDVSIKEVEAKNTLWHRVIVGPFDSKLILGRTRTRLAGANIEAIQMRLCE
ncbi:MAG: SPOR domain-containing protein [Pseudomonadales bacterium]|nr:SPOR domain-containing protein [Pseudomonadales bacterium]